MGIEGAEEKIGRASDAWVTLPDFLHPLCVQTVEFVIVAKSRKKRTRQSPSNDVNGFGEMKQKNGKLKGKSASCMITLLIKLILLIVKENGSY